MYYHRRLLDNLVKWKDSSIRKPLIIRGARQVGKTSLVRLFGETSFKQVVEINLEKVNHRRVFEQAVSVQDFLTRVRLFFEIDIVPGETLLFIDEIQASRTVLELLRFFSEELPKLHVVAAGSPLEVKLMTGSWAIPVGRVDYMYLFPLTFSEFLVATNRKQLATALEKWSLGTKDIAVSDLATVAFREYLLVGGMPEAVMTYAKYQNMTDLQTIYKRLMTAYLEDVVKYAPKPELAKYIEHVIKTGPSVAGTTFSYEGFGGGNYRSREMSEAVGIVEKVMLLKQVMAVNSTKLPLVAKPKKPKKLLWLDVGLVNAINHAYEEILVGEYEGKIMEQVVGQSLVSVTNSAFGEIYYWSRNRDEGSAEVDFVTQMGEKMIAFEVKSGKYFSMKSMVSLVAINSEIVPVRVSFDEPGVDEIISNGEKHKVLVLPVYLLEFWVEWVGKFLLLK